LYKEESESNLFSSCHEKEEGRMKRARRGKQHVMDFKWRF